MDQDPGEYLTLAELAELLGLKESSLQVWLSNEGITGEYRYRTDEVLERRAQMPGRGRKRKAGS